MLFKNLLCSLFLLFSFGLSSQTLLKDVNDLGNGGSGPHNWAAINDELFIFQAINTLESQYLFASDGTAAGTIGLGAYQVDTDIIHFKDRAYFGGCNLFLSADSCFSLFTSDGTVEGTSLFFDFVPNGISSGVGDIVVGDSLFYFSGQTPENGVELYRSNGTIEGTFRVADIVPGPLSGYNNELAVIDDIAYFAGYTEETGIEPWRSDGTPEGTYMIADLNNGTASGFPAFFTASGGFVYFSGLGTGTGVEVRRTNGEEGNVELIGEMGTTDSSNPHGFVDSDGRLYYAAEGNDAAGFDLFVYDHVGMPVHLEMPSGDIFPRALMPFGDGEVIFNANNGAGRELWRSDGTQANTHMIIDLYPGEDDGVYGVGLVDESFYVCNDSLVYFAGSDGISAAGEFMFELFVTDGTAEGTKLVKDHFPGTEGGNPGNFFEFNNRIYYAATDPDVGREPFYLNKNIVNETVDLHKTISIIKDPYPNPCSRGSSIYVELLLKERSNVVASIYNLFGELIMSNRDFGFLPQGIHTVNLELNVNTSGLYQLVLESNHGRTSSLILLE